ncbi:hypothetical protein LCGC14_1618850 [marine sediment metagenome]|uniref:DUF2341 domain-containing protein n=1 Tax=marine sediment metagenome TaxID=412755 RepID=A0A0F9L617_9ZZZZ
MALPFSLPENYKVVPLGFTAANAVDCDIISCKNAHKVWFLIYHNGSSDTDLTLSLVEAKSVAGSTTNAVTAVFPVWYNQTATTAGDTLTKVGTDSNSYVVNVGEGGAAQFVIIEWDPSKHSVDYDCIKVGDSGGNASNNVSITAIVETRYPQANPPSVIVD